MASLRKRAWPYLVAKFLDIDKARCLYAFPLKIVLRHREGSP